MSTPMSLPGSGDHRPHCLARAAGAVTVAGAWVLLHVVRFDLLTRLVQAAIRRGRPATRTEAAATVRVVDAGSVWIPARVACLERSLAVVLLAAARRRAVTWCYGTSTRPPLRMHAWIESPAGAPVGESDDFSYLAARRITPDYGRH